MSTPAFQAFDRVVITEPGQEPPVLGEPIPEIHEDTVVRKRFQFNHNIDTSKVYTMSFNHTYLSPLEWKMHGVPVIKSFEIDGFTKVMRLSVYEVVEESGGIPTDTKGHVQALATGRHGKRSTIMWIQIQRQA